MNTQRYFDDHVPHIPSGNKHDDGTLAALISCRIEDIEAVEAVEETAQTTLESAGV